MEISPLKASFPVLSFEEKFAETKEIDLLRTVQNEVVASESLLFLLLLLLLMLLLLLLYVRS
jgi:hypothetical protein